MTDKMHSILFVDDDPLVLRGYRRSLAEYDGVWDADFASSAQEALIKLKTHHFDAVITDMHMPVMDGLQLLEAVSQSMPQVMRFVLSGNANENQVLRSTPLVHQMIPKPSDMERIYTIVERSCRLGDILKDQQLHRIITGIKTLPSVPLLYNRLLQELQSENTSAASVGNIIAQDVAMTAKILHLVNSAFFGIGDHVTNPQRAVSLLGLNTVKALVLGIQVFSEYQGSAHLPISVDALWKHSLQVSNLAFKVARGLGLSSADQENARVSGILHDIGKLLLLKIPGFFQIVRPGKKGEIAVESEYQVLGTSHAEMGAYLLGIWGIPTQIVEAIMFHHRPNDQIFEQADLMAALHIANGLSSMTQHEKTINYISYLDLQYIQKAGLINRLDEWAVMARELAGSAG